MMKIRTREELNQKYREYSRSLKSQKKQILVCGGTGCVAGGSLKIYAKLQELLLLQGINCVVKLEKEPEQDSVGLKKADVTVSAKKVR